ncbi:unnamed protein product [Prunus armeniaca]|uniref:Uncharacterized protein n=1 Tax=Prunus armeniaca TaxID=36596 RepID=A0A6J5W3X9_PRUAR|nr:unnamed protein product [Prunus armeniaca]
MQPDQSNDTWGGFQIGPKGLIPIDEKVYHSRPRNQAYVDVVNEVVETGYRRMFYTPEMQRLVVRHRLQANNIRSQYQLNIEAHSYNQVLEDAAIIAADMWPPPGIDLPYVPEPQDLNLPHVPDPGDEAYLELLDLDALSAESVASSAPVVIIEQQNPSPTIINISSDDENEYPEPIIPHVEVIDISSDDE